MLIAVVTIFATLWLPHRGMLVYNTVAALTGFGMTLDTLKEVVRVGKTDLFVL